MTIFTILSKCPAFLHLFLEKQKTKKPKKQKEKESKERKKIKGKK
jgi:hypothetical protein